MEKKCIACSAITQQSDKFCHSCGMTLVQKCDVCDCFTSVDARFCPECGAKNSHRHNAKVRKG